jgi:hypothetical protein
LVSQELVESVLELAYPSVEAVGLVREMTRVRRKRLVVIHRS